MLPDPVGIVPSTSWSSVGPATEAVNTFRSFIRILTCRADNDFNIQEYIFNPCHAE